MSVLRVAGTIPESIVDGPGIRYVLFTQGCPHRCPGCHNPQTHDFSGGREMTVEALLADITARPYVKAVTFSGGEPFAQPGWSRRTGSPGVSRNSGATSRQSEKSPSTRIGRGTTGGIWRTPL